jgi:hypothetical protein
MQQMSGELEQQGDGEFELLISPDQAASIDDYEASLLRANYPAVRSVSIDDVGVKRQKVQRPKQGDVATTPTKPKAGAAPTKFIHTTVAEVQTEVGRYVLSANGVEKVLRLWLAFLLQNVLTGRPLICFWMGREVCTPTWRRSCAVIAAGK